MQRRIFFYSDMSMQHAINILTLMRINGNANNGRCRYLLQTFFRKTYDDVVALVSLFNLSLELCKGLLCLTIQLGVRSQAELKEAESGIQSSKKPLNRYNIVMPDRIQGGSPHIFIVHHGEQAG